MRITLAVVLGIAALLVPGTATAAPPGNDDFANATVIDPSSLPYSDSVAIDEATVEPGDGHGCPYFGMAHTVWYKITPTSKGMLQVSGNGSAGYQFTAGYLQTGAGPGDLSLLACGDWYWGTNDLFAVEPGTTYYLQSGTSFNSPGTGGIRVQLIQPPPNDDFDNAQSIGSLPFSDTEDTTAGTNESGEPTPSCSYTGQAAGSMWYRYTAATDGWVSANMSGGPLVYAAYTGGALGSLSEKTCRTYGRLTFAVQAGQTYSFLVGGLYGVKGILTFHLEVAPNPVANFGTSIGDPSIYDTIQFYNGAYDPGDVGISSFGWSFGDGTTSIESYPTHRYLTDGSFKVRFTVQTLDGRSGTTEQIIVVSTHDVAVSKMTVPQSASAGQTRSIVVGLSNRRYAETVRIDLYRSTAAGFDRM